MQTEANLTGVRHTPANRDRFGDATATVVGQYLSAHWGLSLGVAARVTTAARVP